MKKNILLISMILISTYCLMSCNRKIEKVVVQEKNIEKELPSFEDNLDAFIHNDIDVINKLINGEIAPCENIDDLLQFRLKNCNEEICLRIIKLAVENKGNFTNAYSITSPLIESCKLNYYDLTQYLITTKAKEDINYSYSQYAPPLFWAMKNGNEKLVELLLENGADPNGHTVGYVSYMAHLDDFIERNLISFEKAEIIKDLLIQYGYKEGV